MSFRSGELVSLPSATPEKRAPVRKVGRPRKLESADEVYELAEEYVASTDRPTIGGLALYLGLSGWKRLSEYEQRGEFSEAVKWAKARVLAHLEAAAIYDRSIGAIFVMKCSGIRENAPADDEQRHVTFDEFYQGLAEKPDEGPLIEGEIADDEDDEE